MTKITFKIVNEQEVQILKDGVEVGQIFSPAGSGQMHANCVQICGFSEAFDLWGCGPYKGFKDVQLLFDGKKMEGEFTVSNFDKGCYRCYHIPCACDTNVDGPRMYAKHSHDADMKARIEMCKPKDVNEILKNGESVD